MTLYASIPAYGTPPFLAQCRAAEIVAAPKVYGFDTGFVCYYRGWHELRKEDFGVMWEHFVLNEITARMQSREVFYWRDKRGHEIDFVLAPRRKKPLVIECKWSADNFDGTNLRAFRWQYPEGDNVVLAHDVVRGYSRGYGDLRVRFGNLASFAGSLAG